MKHYFFVFTLVCFLASCGSNQRSVVRPDEATNQGVGSYSVDLVNQKLEADSSLINRREYRVGVGDVLDVLVYLVADVSRQYQVNSNGEIQMPLVGGVSIGGMTVIETQNEIARTLAQKYVKNPQVTVSILEYGSNEVTVSGEVGNPKIYAIKEGRNPFEMLVIAGGLKKTASSDMHITHRTRNPETGRLQAVKTIANLHTLFDPKTPEDYDNIRVVKNIVLGDGDSIYVPSAGRVYIDGAVVKPGSYELEGDTTILGLIALAGGAEWTSSARKVRVLRKIGRETNKEYKLDLNRIRERKDENFKLQSDDLVMVGHNSLKYGIKAFWEYGLRLIFLPL